MCIYEGEIMLERPLCFSVLRRACFGGGESSGFLELYLNGAFDTITHHILLEKMRKSSLLNLAAELWSWWPLMHSENSTNERSYPI